MMKVISSGWGVVLLFESAGDLGAVIDNLQGMKEACEQGEMEYPATYMEFENEPSEEKARSHLRWLKWVYQQAKE